MFKINVKKTVREDLSKWNNLTMVLDERSNTAKCLVHPKLSF